MIKMQTGLRKKCSQGRLDPPADACFILYKYIHICRYTECATPAATRLCLQYQFTPVKIQGGHLNALKCYTFCF